VLHGAVARALLLDKLLGSLTPDHLILGPKEVKSREGISLFCDLNYIYCGIDLKYGISKKVNIFFNIPKTNRYILCQT
jgi:hypothetical protein